MAVSIEPPELDLERLLVVSPHFDDAVFSCGHLLAAAPGAVVVTVFGGAPDPYPPSPTSWDADCGFAAGADVLAIRRREDADALGVVGAVPKVLDFVDGQYRGSERYSLADVTERLGAVVDECRPTTVAFPLGVRHRDHQLCGGAALKLRERADQRSWVGYAEFPYVWRDADRAASRIARLRRRGLGATPVLGVRQATERKARAMRCYASQMTGFAFHDLVRIAEAPEQLWQITRRPLVDPVAIGWLRRKLRLP
jgi:LmbE family N-acetylglucosaminyl deacetylase